MPEDTDRISVLQTTSLFAGLSREALRNLAASLDEVQLATGEAVFAKGDPGRVMYIVAHGAVRVHDEGQTVALRRAGEVFGEMALLDAKSRLASATAVEPTTLLCLDQATLLGLMGRQAVVAQAVNQMLLRRLRARVHDLGDLRRHLQQVILPLGMALSSADDLEALLQRILVEAKSFCRADAGTLYLVDSDCLRFHIMLTDSLHIALGGLSGRPIPFPCLPLRDPVTGAPNHHNVATYVALEGGAVNIADIYDSEAFDFSGTRAFDRDNNYRSISSITVPLKDHLEAVIGVLQLFNAQDPASGAVIPFDPYQQLVVESLTSQAAVALNTRMLLRRQKELLKLEHDLQVGRQIQADFLPATLPQLPGYDIAALIRPARQVAGDFYDAFMLPDGRLALAIADVVDKGVGAALFMSLSRSLLRAFALQAGAGAALAAVGRTNDYIARTHEALDMFVTVFFALLDPASGVLEYINGGHNPPVVAAGDGRVLARLGPTGPAVGLIPDIPFAVRRAALAAGDTLLMFTDGVPDAYGPDERFYSEERLLAQLAPPARSAADLLARIDADVAGHIAGAEPFDDMTMLAVQRRP